MKRFKFLAHKMSQNMDSGTGSSYSSDGSQMSKYNVGGGRSSARNFWCFWYDELLEQPREHSWQTVPHRSRHCCCACNSGVRWKGFCCVRPAYCWSQKQNDQVTANVSLFETEQSIGEHRHQCLRVNFGTLTLIEMNCKCVSTKAIIRYSVV